MTTIAEARAIVADNASSDYGDDFLVAPFGWENPDMFLIPAGSIAEVYGPRTVDELNTVPIISGPLRIVYKATGVYKEFYGKRRRALATDWTSFGDRTDPRP